MPGMAGIYDQIRKKIRELRTTLKGKGMGQADLEDCDLEEITLSGQFRRARATRRKA
jgi:hypothetical protein